MPVEVMVELANEAGVNMWVNMPTNASDDYIRYYAAYVRDHLRPDLTVHVEYSNEVWNFGFVQATYAYAKAKQELANGVPGADGVWLTWYGKRTAQIGIIWKEVFGEPLKSDGNPGRVRMVFGTQFEYKGIEGYGLNATWIDSAGTKRNAVDYFDEYAIAPYVYTYDDYEKSDHDDQVRALMATPDRGHSVIAASIIKKIQQDFTKIYAYHAGMAGAHKLKLVAYEGGAGSMPQTNSQEMNSYWSEITYSPEIADVHRANLKAFRDAGGELFNYYNLMDYYPYAALLSVKDTSAVPYQTLRSLQSQ